MNRLAETPPWLRRYTKLTAASTVFLVFAGAMVTSTGSGLAVPDWPLAYGMVFPPMVGGIFYEHGHRLIASLVGLLTVIQAIWLQKSETKRFIRRLGWFSLLAVIVQGLLGGLTVILLLPPAVSVSHAALAEIFLALNVSIAFFTSRSYLRMKERDADGESFGGVSRFLVVAFFVQVLVGAVMRHLGAGLAIPDFPLSFGRLIPEFTSVGIVFNFIHRVWGLILGVAVLVLYFSVSRAADRSVRRVFSVLTALVIVQIVLGAFTIWSQKDAIITSLHVMTGAATVSTAVILALTAGVIESKQRREALHVAEREAIA